jgi:hypothetical protein
MPRGEQQVGDVFLHRTKIRRSMSLIAGKTVACHFNTFTSLAFSGPAATSPPSTHDTATFTTGPSKSMTAVDANNPEQALATEDRYQVLCVRARDIEEVARAFLQKSKPGPPSRPDAR